MSVPFTREDFEAIWGTVHRHDYTDDLAERLVLKYGKVRYLDLGTGCGHLVKRLRERGADAWGTEISRYALDNSCAPGYVVYGDVRDLPFRDGRFDVVLSNGLWEYVREEDVDRAVGEVYRVGKYQEHIIDHDETVRHPEYKYVTWKSLSWWKDKLAPPRILVGSATHQVKEYCFPEWVERVKSLTYPDYDIFVVDNSPSDELSGKYDVPIRWIGGDQSPDQWLNRICRSMAEIQKHFLVGPYTHWMNIESDVIPPRDVIERMLAYKDADWVSHAYPTRAGGCLQQGIGCSLLSRRLMSEFSWADAADSPDSELWAWVQNEARHKTVELWYEMNVEHRKN